MKRCCDVIVPVKNSPWWVSWCLEELFRNTAPELLGSVMVVDDGSNADCLAALRAIVARYPSATLTDNRGRPGFGGACNFAVSRTSSRWFLLLNSDCLVTPGLLEKLVAATEADPTIGLACPLSNNSPELTLPLSPGRSYLEMNRLFEQAYAGCSPTERVADACTVVGNCLLVTRCCWEATGEFDVVWGQGYGEETDLQFRAMAKGFRGVAVLDAYVYHFGSATFRFESGVDALRARANTLFHSKWGPAYREHARVCERRAPVRTAREQLASLGAEHVSLDVMFLLPGISQGVGGIHAVVDICNHLIRRGVKAACAVLGHIDAAALEHYHEPILFGLLQFPDREALLLEPNVSTRVVVGTLFTTIPAAQEYAQLTGARMVNFIQGYECYFSNGQHWAEVEESYELTETFLTTSRWLEDRVRRHQPQRTIIRQPVGVNRDIFFPPAVPAIREKLTVACVLRSAPDKGQWLLLEVMHRLWPLRDRVSLVVLRAPGYHIPERWTLEPGVEQVDLPLGREQIAHVLRRADVLLDASLHEGFGLLPLEAMACGATAIVSASGGVQDFVIDEQNGLVVHEALNPDAYVKAVQRLAEDPGLLSRLRVAALDTAAGHDADASYDAYARILSATTVRPSSEETAVLADPAEGEVVFTSGEAARYAGLSADRDAIIVGQAAHLLTSSGDDPSFSLPVRQSPESSVLRIRLASAVDTTLQVYVPWVPEMRHSRIAAGVRAAAGLVGLARVRYREDLRVRYGEDLRVRYREDLSVTGRVACGWNTVYLRLPPLQAGVIRIDPACTPGDFVLASVELRETPDINPDTDPAALREAFKTSQTVLARVDGGHPPNSLLTPTQVQVSTLGPCLLPIGTKPRFVFASNAPLEGRSVCIEAELDSPRATLFQVFYGRHGARGFSPSRSGTRRVAAGPNQLQIVLTDTRMDGTYRIHFATGAGTVHLRSLVARAFTSTEAAGDR